MLALASPALVAWNPYDADSSWSSPAGDGFDSSRHETVDYGWGSQTRGTDWGERDRWRDTSGDRTSARHDKWRQHSQPDYRNEPAGEGISHQQRQAWSSQQGGDYAPFGARGYEFRHDPELDALRPGHQNGWVFRPLSERESARPLADSPYPRIDERDYLPRGPWRSYQDEGAAFGYHPDDGWPSDSLQLR